MDFQMRRSAAVIVAGLMLVDPPVADVDGKPADDSTLSGGWSDPNEYESEKE
jgi:hypothetical protein